MIRESRPMPGIGRLPIRQKRRLNPKAASGSAQVSASGCALSRPSSNRPAIRSLALAGARLEIREGRTKALRGPATDRDGVRKKVICDVRQVCIIRTRIVGFHAP